ncbi:MAG: hypothetical protein EON58_03115 [Alphaproteobacteria bacterium]|nr:MAG: hypothetical protein EON58_03115 [Alphaproteobacteria bacterium]
MKIQLTPQEQKELIWQEGDYFEVIRGTATFTQVDRYEPQPNQAGAIARTTATFFFDSADGSWGDQEWEMNIGSDIPNGPALLILLRRDEIANAFGIVSMVNRAWTHQTFFGALPLYANSTAGKALKKRNWLFFLAVVIGLPLLVSGCWLVCVLIPLLPILLAIPAARDWVKKTMHGRNPDDITAAARGLMYRVAKKADQYWPEDDVSGKL